MITAEFKDLEEMKDFARGLLGAEGAVQTPETYHAAPAAPISSVPIVPSADLITAQYQAAPTPVYTQPAPTSVHSFTLEDLTQAGMTLMDAGRQDDLLQLLASFGTESVPALPQAQYGAFATALRGMGAPI